MHLPSNSLKRIPCNLTVGQDLCSSSGECLPHPQLLKLVTQGTYVIVMLGFSYLCLGRAFLGNSC